MKNTNPIQQIRIAASARPLEGLRLLIAEDEADTRTLLMFMRKQQGVLVQSAASAQQAMVCLETHVTDILISDIGLPQ